MPNRSNLKLRFDDLDDYRTPDRPDGWHLFNDFHSLNRRGMPNILYFHLKNEEFDQIAGLLDHPRHPSADSSFVGKGATLAALEDRFRSDYRKSGEWGMRVAVGVFATLVFSLPVVLNFF